MADFTAILYSLYGPTLMDSGGRSARQKNVIIRTLEAGGSAGHDATRSSSMSSSKLDSRFAAIDRAASAAEEPVQQGALHHPADVLSDGSFPTYLMRLLSAHERRASQQYIALPRKVAQWILKHVCAAWDSFRRAHAAWKTQIPAARNSWGRPRLPRYRDKQRGRDQSAAVQALSVPALRAQQICPSGLGITLQTRQDPQCIHQVRIVPRASYYVVEVIYER